LTHPVAGPAATRVRSRISHAVARFAGAASRTTARLSWLNPGTNSSARPTTVNAPPKVASAWSAVRPDTPRASGRSAATTSHAGVETKIMVVSGAAEIGRGAGRGRGVNS